MTDAGPSGYAADDAILLNLVSIGDTGAFEVLRQRHEQAALRLARCLVAADEADDVVAEAFALLLDVTAAGSGPADAFRPYLLTVVRQVSRETQNTGLETSLIVRAFRSLPGRWIAALWHAEIEQTSPAENAQILGLSPDAVAALNGRARDGLQQAYLRLHLAEVARPECQPAVSCLAAFAQDAGSGGDWAMVTEHLGSCDECRVACSELTGIGDALRTLVAPALLGSAATAYLSAVTVPTALTAGQAEPEAAAGRTGTAAKQRRVSRPRLWTAVGAVVAFAVVAGIVAGLSGQGRRSPRLQQAQAAGAPTPGRTAARPSTAPSAKGSGGTPDARASGRAREPATSPVIPQSPVTHAGPVAVGGAGPSPSGAVASNASVLSWAQMVSGSDTAVVVGVAVGQNVDDSGLSASVTDNGAAMTALATVHDDGQSDGYLEVFGLAGVPDGTNTIRVAVAGGPVQELTGGSVSFDGAAQAGTFSAPATAFGNSATPAVTVGSTSGGAVAAFAACGSAIVAATPPATQEFIANDDDNSGAGNSAGATSAATGGHVSVAWSAGDDFWGAIAVQVND